MVLEQFNIPSSPITTFINLLTTQLESVVDSDNKPLNVSVGTGLDAVLKSAIDGIPNAEDMPCARVFYDPHTVTISNAQNVTLFQNLPISIYWLFNIDFPSTNFQELREDFIRWNLHYLKMNKFSDNIGMGTYTWWKYDDYNPITIQHNTQLKYMGQTYAITPASNFSCTRVDLNVIIKNYLGPDDRQLS